MFIFMNYIFFYCTKVIAVLSDLFIKTKRFQFLFSLLFEKYIIKFKKLVIIKTFCSFFNIVTKLQNLFFSCNKNKKKIFLFLNH